MADPDFLSLLEENRLQPSKAGITSPKARAREQDKVKAYLNEEICLRLVPPRTLSADNDNTTQLGTAGTTWNIPRFRLTESFLQETVNRGRHASSPTLIVSHLHDRRSNTVILPKDLYLCRSAPVGYEVHVISAVGVQKGGVLAGPGDSYYKGDVIFHITRLPARSKSEQYAVVPDDVHRWLVDGAISGVEAIQIHTTKIETLRQTLQQLEKDAKNVHTAPIYNENGRAVVGSPLKDAREAKLRSLQDEQEQMKSRLEKAIEALEAERARHFAACSLQITERSEKGQTGKEGKVSFAVKVTGKKKTKEYYTGLIVDKTDWNLVPLYATGDKDARSKSKHTSSSTSPLLVATIGDVDQVNHFVDLRTVSIELLPDGFGVHESYQECDFFSKGSKSEKTCTRGRHRMFHGHFREGQYHKGTLHTDAGVYSGTFLSNEPCRGNMKYSDGCVLTGKFSMQPKGGGQLEDSSPLGPNPYRRGLPHGNDVNIQFKDGSVYEGGLHEGSITGNGVYRYPTRDGITPSGKKSREPIPFTKLGGAFYNGMLLNNDGVEGQGGSNLRRSFVFSGERIWGP